MSCGTAVSAHSAELTTLVFGTYSHVGSTAKGNATDWQVLYCCSANRERGGGSHGVMHVDGGGGQALFDSVRRYLTQDCNVNVSRVLTVKYDPSYHMAHLHPQYCVPEACAASSQLVEKFDRARDACNASDVPRHTASTAPRATEKSCFAAVCPAAGGHAERQSQTFEHPGPHISHGATLAQ
jgi:hypothetical protein